jgi:hypothetical protein
VEGNIKERRNKPKKIKTKREEKVWIKERLEN